MDHGRFLHLLGRSLGGSLELQEELGVLPVISPGSAGLALRWTQVLPECLHLRSHVSSTIILILHAASNDVGYRHSVDLFSAIKWDIAQCYAVYTNLVLIWSEIVPRLLWAKELPGPRLEHFRQ